PPPEAPEEQRYWLASFYPVRPSRDESQGIGVVFTEITERKQAEAVHDQLIREQAAFAATEGERARLQAILERAPSVIIVVDAVNDRLIANPVANQIFGHPLRPEAGRAQYANQLLYPDGRPVPFAELPSSRALRGEVAENEEYLIRQPSGQTVPIRGSTAPIRGPNGEILGVVGVYQDITAQKENERLREEWISLIAHDLRQPVTSISGYASMLLRESAQLSPSVVKKIEHVRTSAQNLNRMIADLLDVSRIEANRLTLQSELVSLPTLVQAVVERARGATAGHPVQVESHRPVPEVLADPGRIEQVLTNLLSNAAKYGEPGAPITVRLESRTAEVEISVTNQGPGIPPEQMPRLFQRFYRTPEARDGRVAGLGLGLYITKGLVEAHGGRVWATSIPGQITTFTFTLPTKEAKSASDK
ncbi:MAG TPA: ATP-binding protein, partial [Chloroflexota bacterium]|nr:ATP-binding protein [Chloroflexota bacterium]